MVDHSQLDYVETSVDKIGILAPAVVLPRCYRSAPNHPQALASNGSGSASAEGKDEFFHLNSGLARIGCEILCTQWRMVAELL